MVTSMRLFKICYIFLFFFNSSLFAGLNTIEQNDLIIKKKLRKVDNKFYFIKDHISGESSKSKINKVVKYLREDKSDCLFITAPENVAWLLNLRGRDNPHSPIPNCRLILKNNSEIYLFVNKLKIFQSSLLFPGG